MSKEEVLKVKTHLLKVNIHCDGCKVTVKKILQKVDGVFTMVIDSEQGKVTVSGNVDPALLIRKLNKAGKHAESWEGSQKPNKNKNARNLEKQFKSMQIGGNPKGSGWIDGKGSRDGSHGNEQKGDGGGVPPQVPSQNSQQIQQLQQQMKEFQDMSFPHFKEMNAPPFGVNGSGNQGMKQCCPPGQRHVRFCLPQENVADDDEDENDDVLGGEMCGDFPRKMKENMTVMTMNGNNYHCPHVVNAQIGGNNASHNNGKKGAGGVGNGALPDMMGRGNGGKKGPGGGGNSALPAIMGGGNGGNRGPGSSVAGNNSTRGHGGPQIGGNDQNSHGGKTGGGRVFEPASNGFPVAGGGPNPYPMMGSRNFGPMGWLNQATRQTGILGPGQTGDSSPAVQGLPSGPGGLPSNCYKQQQQQQQQAQYLATGMNQNDHFQPMMYSRPPPSNNYAPLTPYSYPYPYPYPGLYVPQPQGDSRAPVFSDDNTSSCTVM